ncbi:hypothetical protein HX021_12210 [Sphingobacterium sp. N143]|nr:hypothetical protein [Sphingobacterium sp. N143]MDM1295046.1 hypothetical protein [Sphingobacterium sp. N143]
MILVIGHDHAVENMDGLPRSTNDKQDKIQSYVKPCDANDGEQDIEE